MKTGPVLYFRRLPALLLMLTMVSIHAGKFLHTHGFSGKVSEAHHAKQHYTTDKTCPVCDYQFSKDGIIPATIADLPIKPDFPPVSVGCFSQTPVSNPIGVTLLRGPPARS